MRQFQRFLLAWAAGLCLCFSSTAAAQRQALDDELPPGATRRPTADDALTRVTEGPRQPMRLLLSVTGGTSLRIVNDRDLRQTRFAPSYLDVFGALVFPTTSSYRHGVGLGISTNLTGDGGFDLGVSPFQQYMFTPSYVGYVRMSEDFELMLHAGLTAGLTKVSQASGYEPILGAEVAVGASYLVLAGLGIYVEAGSSMFLGTANTKHPIVSLEAGLLLDYEVLP